MLTIEGTKVENTKRDIAANLKPYGIDVTPAGDVAIVASIGVGATGGSDTLSVIDLAANPPRTVNHVSVGPVAEGLAISPDGRHVAVTVMNGSNAAKTSPFFNDYGWLRIYSLNRTALALVAETQIGHWCQGVAWSADAPHRARAMRRRTRDHDVQLRRPAAGSRRADQGQWRAVGDSDGAEDSCSARQLAQLLSFAAVADIPLASVVART